MKALVLCGGIPQLALIEELKRRGIVAVLADQNEKAPAVPYADKFYPVSTLDVEGIRRVAVEEQVDFLITVCADQMLLVVAQVSEMLGLPCYLDYETAKNVSDKSFMKKIFVDHGIPTSHHVIMDHLDPAGIAHLKYPLIVKPVDSYSSRGVRKVFSLEELRPAFEDAVTISRTKTAVIEEFVQGDELTIDVYVENGQAHLLCISQLDKIPGNDRFVICRTRYPAQISPSIREKVQDTAQKIADAFGLRNSPMLIQLITDGENISVLEFCARTGGGDKFRLIEKVTGFNVVNAVLDLTMGQLPHVNSFPENQCIINEFLYCKPGVFNHLEGFDELLSDGIITEYYQLKARGTEMKQVSSSGDRVAYFTIADTSMDSLKARYETARKKIKAISTDGEDILRHDLLEHSHF